MEKLKDPAMILSVVNTLGMIGTTAYFFKQIEAIRLDMVKMSQALSGVLRKISETEKGDQHQNEALHTLNDQIKHINDNIQELPTFQELPSFDDFSMLDADIVEILRVLADKDIQIDRPTHVPQGRNMNRRDRHVPQRDSNLDDRRHDTQRRPQPRIRNEASDYDSYQTPRTRPELRPQPRPQPTLRPRPEPRQEPSTGGYEDDDSELIRQVRSQARN